METENARLKRLEQDEALLARERWRLSSRDAATIDVARLCGCETVLSEDFHHVRNFEGITVTNPFLSPS